MSNFEITLNSSSLEKVAGTYAAHKRRNDYNYSLTQSKLHFC